MESQRHSGLLLANARLELLDFIEGKRQPPRTDSKPREVVKKHLLILVQGLVNSTDFGDGKSSNDFVKLFTNLNWYSTDCGRKDTCSIFIDIFVSMASEYPVLVPSLLKVFLDVAFTLNPPDRYEETLGLFVSGVAEILNSYPSSRDETLLNNLDNVLYHELLTGLACIPIVAGGRAFTALSFLRITIESRCRKFFSPILRRILVSVISKTWQSQLLQKVTNDCARDSRREKNTTSTLKKAKKEQLLVNVADHVTDLLYGENENNEKKRISLKRNRGHDEELHVGTINDEVMHPCHVLLDEFPDSLPAHEILIKNERIGKAETTENSREVPHWFKTELSFYASNCSEDNQLSATILLRIMSWFSSRSSNRLFISANNYDGKLSESYSSHTADFSHYSHINISADILDWMKEAILTIFQDDFSTKNITIFLPLWTGAYYFFPVKNKKSESVQYTEMLRKFDSFKIKFNVLKSYILCSMSEVLNNVDILISSLLTRITYYFIRTEIRNIELSSDCYLSFLSPKVSCFLSFLSMFEFLIQLLSNLSIYTLNQNRLLECLKKLIFIAIGLRRNIFIGLNDDDDYDKYDVSGHSYHSNGMNTDIKDIDSNSNRKKNTTKKMKNKEGKINKKLMKLSILSLVSLTSGIGYILSQRFSNEKTVLLLLNCKDWDVLNDISTLFNIHPFNNEIQKNKRHNENCDNPNGNSDIDDHSNEIQNKSYDDIRMNENKKLKKKPPS